MQNEIFLSFIKILFFFLVGSFISFIADFTGKKIGKKKIVLFNLRPKYTAMLITVITGGLIATFSIILLSFLSKDARIYLFQINTLMKQTEFYKNEVKILQQKYLELTKDISLLIQTTHMGDIIFIKNQPIYVFSFYNSDASKNYIYQVLDKLEELVKQKYKLKVKDISLPENLVRLDNINEIYKELRNNRFKKLAFIFYCKRNTFVGEYVDVDVNVIEDKVIVPANTVLSEIIIDDPYNIEQNFSLIMDSISMIQEKLIKEGKLFLPQENSIGGQIPFQKIITELVKIRESSNFTKNKNKFKIFLINKEDIYIAGKFEITVKTVPYY